MLQRRAAFSSQTSIDLNCGRDYIRIGADNGICVALRETGGVPAFRSEIGYNALLELCCQLQSYYDLAPRVSLFQIPGSLRNLTQSVTLVEFSIKPRLVFGTAGSTTNRRVPHPLRSLQRVGYATVGIEIRGIPPFAKSAKDGAPGL
jgi:hypothetical protein